MSKKIPYYNGEPGIVPESEMTKIRANRWSAACLTERRPRKDVSATDLAISTKAGDFIFQSNVKRFSGALK